MIPEAPLVFSVAGLSASFAGLAGLVMGLRRGAELRPIDSLRLRQMVEGSFANILLAIAVIPLAAWLGTTSAAAQVDALAIVVFFAGSNALYRQRTIRMGMRWGGWWLRSVLLYSAVSILLGLFVAATGRVDAFEGLLVLLLLRPMLPFLLVLHSWEAESLGDRADTAG